MTSNRLTGAGSGSQGNGLRPGETRVLHDRPPSPRVWTVYRTNRDYVHDLCDAYNAGLIRPDVRWIVMPSGELTLVNAQDGISSGRDGWKPDEREQRLTRDVCAEFANDPSVTQEQFNHMVRSGKINRLVDYRLSLSGMA